MATTITAGNATNGAAVSSDNTGILELKTGTGSGTTAVTIGTDQAVTFAAGTTINGITVGRGGGSVATNTAVGASALAANTTGANNTVVGYQAANSTTSSNVTAFGYQAMYGANWATPSASTAVGYRALYNGGGNNDTAVGYEALSSTTSASGSNTAVGKSALTATTTGTSNTALGGGALVANTTGIQNTALGALALQSNTTASNNTAVGFQAGRDTTSGSNTFVGKDAGLTVSSGAGNTYIGFGAGPNGSAGTGAQNTCVGYLSGNAITSGAKNTILGGYTGNQNSFDIQTLSNKVVVSDGDGLPVFHNDSTRWGTNAFGTVDITNNSSTTNVLAITANTATVIFNNTFSGVIIVNDINILGACAICIFGGGSLSIIGQSGSSNYFVNSSTPASNQIGLYRNGGDVVLKPNPTSGAATNFRIIAFRTRTAS